MSLKVQTTAVQVKRIDYYQRTDQALSQLLSGAAVDVNNPEVTTYLHGDGLLTLRMAQLPDGQGLPGADTNQIWFWLRPRQVSTFTVLLLEADMLGIGTLAPRLCARLRVEEWADNPVLCACWYPDFFASCLAPMQL